MRKSKIIYALETICSMIENDIMGNPDAMVNTGAILCGDDIDDYKIEGVSKCIGDIEGRQVAVRVRFHTKSGNTWHGKFYFA